MSVGCRRWLSTTLRRFSSRYEFPTDARYVERIRLLDYWKMHDKALMSEFHSSKFLLIVDKKALVTVKDNEVRLAVFSYADLKRRVGQYGVSFDINISCLVDAVEAPDTQLMPLFGTAVKTIAPPEDSPIRREDVLKQLGDSLGGRFMDVRLAMLNMPDEVERNRLATFKSVISWADTYRRCPKCASLLRMRLAKSAAECESCRKVYYPTFSPVSITLVTDDSMENALLVRHRGSANSIYTCIAGFAHSGESIFDCTRREIAEEVGVTISSTRSLGLTQPWPMPDSSLMIAHHAVADMKQTVTLAPDELEAAGWFNKSEVEEALRRTEADPFLKNIPKDVSERQALRYIPPRGAIAHSIIKQWVDGKLRL